MSDSYSYSTDGGGEGEAEGEGDLAARFARELGLGSEDADTTEQGGDLDDEGAQEGQAAELTPAAWEGKFAAAGDDEMAALGGQTLASASAVLKADWGEDAAHTSAVVDALDETPAFTQALAAAHEAEETGQFPTRMTPHPHAHRIFDEGGELLPEVQQYLAPDTPWAQDLRKGWGRNTERNTALALRYLLSIDTTGRLYSAFDDRAGWRDVNRALKWGYARARKLKQ